MKTRRWLLIVLCFATISCLHAPSQTEDHADTRTDTEALAQSTIDLKQMDRYYHVDALPERSPLIIMTNQLVNATMRLHKFGKPVVYMDKAAATSGRKPHFEFRAISIGGTGATVQFAYPAEGIVGTAGFKKKENAWEVVRCTLVEK